MTSGEIGKTTNVPAVQSVWWKKLAITSLFGGVGFALVLAATVGLVGWYSSRPTPPKAWNTHAIVASGPPSFGVSGGGKNIELSYTLQNATDTDYKVDPDAQIRLLVKWADGTFSPQMPKEAGSVTLPIFIPAGQKVQVTLSLVFTDIPQRIDGETDEEYHERLRAYLEHKGGGVSFAVFEEANRYQINLPKWLSKQPPKEK